MEKCQFRNTTKDYLTRFYEILEEMIKDMEGAELTDSLSHNFIVQMIPHHMAAIEMSENVLQYNPCRPVRSIAENIIVMQTKSIQDMLDVKYACSKQTNSPQDLSLYQRRFRQITHTMFTEMGEACSDNHISADFMREMIPHHQGAVSMSENVLHYCICPALQPILEAIIVSQRQGIREMKC